jgi:hypothetical protein
MQILCEAPDPAGFHPGILRDGNIAVKPAPIRLSALEPPLIPTSRRINGGRAIRGAQAAINRFASRAYVCLYTKCQLKVKKS